MKDEKEETSATRSRIAERIKNLRESGKLGGGETGEETRGGREENRTGTGEGTNFEGTSGNAETSSGSPEPFLINVGETSGASEGTRKRSKRRNETTERRKTQTQNGRKTKTPPAKPLDVEEDREDLRNLVVGVFDGFANLTRFDGFTMPEDEADTIAKPLSRIIHRHGFSETVRTVSDPGSLIIATFTCVFPRIVAYNQWKQAVAEQHQQQYTRPNNVVDIRQTVKEPEQPIKDNDEKPSVQGKAPVDFSGTPG